MRPVLAACLSCALCGACEMAGARAEDKREIAPLVLLVQHPAASVAALGIGPQSLFRQPSATPDGSTARPFPTLASALRAAPAGALLRIEEGTWHERLTIVRPVVLMGRGATRTRIVSPDGAETVVEVRGADHVELYGLSIEGGQVGLLFEGGAGHRVENVELRDCREAGLRGRGASITFASSEVTSIGRGIFGRGIDLDGGSLEARKLVLRAAGRRGIVLRAARGMLEDVDVRDSGLSALQAIDGAEVRVLRGVYEGQSGAALYAGRARLSIECALVRHDDYAVIGFRGSEISVLGGEVTDYHVAGVALVKSHGSVQGTTFARGGTEAAISITRADGRLPVLLVDNRIRDPGTMGVHITESSVTALGNTITGARLDREKDLGDAFFAIDSTLVIERNVLRANAGSGISATRSTVQLAGNGFIENGRAGVLLLDRSRGNARSNVFERNARAGVELSERARAVLSENRFGGNLRFDIDAGCEKGFAGIAEIAEGNIFAAPLRERSCD